MTKQLFLKAWVVCAIAACGSVSTNPPDAHGGGDSGPPGDFSLTTDMMSLASPITGTATLTVTVARGTGFTDAIALTATNLPTGVTAAFGAASLPSGTDSTTVTLTIDAAANAGTSDITITGTAGTLAHSQTVSLALTTQTVTGKVRSNQANITVRLVGKDAVQTDTTGNFTFTDVKVPYDIYVLGQGGPNSAPVPAITYYKGLTRLDPVVTQQFPYCAVNCLVIFAGRSATVTGSRSGSGTNAGPTYVKFTTTGGNEVDVDGTWNFTATWFGFGTMNTTIVGRLQGLQATRGALNAPNGWLFGETADATLTTGGSLNLNLILGALASAALSGTITAPAGFPTPTVTLSQQLGGFPFSVWTATTTNATSTIPVLTNQKASFYATTSSAGATSQGVVPGLTASTDVSMTLALPAGITGPVNGATNVTTTTPFAFTTTPKQVYETTMSSGSAIFVIYSTSGALTIPNVSEMPLPSGTGFSWVVNGYGPLNSVDAAADTAPLLGVNQFEATGSFHTQTTTATRSFTTQ